MHGCSGVFRVEQHRASGTEDGGTEDYLKVSFAAFAHGSFSKFSKVLLKLMKMNGQAFFWTLSPFFWTLNPFFGP